MSRTREGPLKVLQVINSFHLGGAETMAKRMALAFDPARVEAHIWSMCPVEEEGIEHLYVDELEAASIPHGCLGKKPHVKDPRAVLKLASLIRKGGFHVVHGHCDSPMLYSRLAATLVPGTPRVVTMHLHMQDWQFTQERYLRYLTDRYVACSSEIMDDLRKAGIDARKCVRILNGIDTQKLRLSDRPRDELRSKWGAAGDAPVALMLARLDAQKAQLDVLEAIDRPGPLQDLRVWMVGNPHVDPDYARRVEQEIARRGLGHRVRTFGLVEDREIDEFMKAADFFLLPSEREGLSVAILESLAAGLPTVISDLQNNREASDDGRVAWLVEPHTPTQLAATLEGLLADPEAMRARAQEAVAYTHRVFSFARVVEEYTQVYEELTGRATG